MPEDEFDIHDDSLQHIGIARRSGRYPWGSGNNPVQRSRDFKSYMEEMKSKGMKEGEILKALNEYSEAHGSREPIRSPDLRAATAAATAHIFAENQALAVRLAEKGMSNGAIAERMGLGRSAESTVRGWLSKSQEIQEGSLFATAEVLKQHLADKPFLDVGKGTELHMGISDNKLRAALSLLKDEGYVVHPLQTPQLGTDKNTKLKVLTKEGVAWKDAHDAMIRGEVQNITSHSDDGGSTYRTPKSELVPVSSKQLQVRYDEDGGSKMDGVVELRRGVPELSLGDARYAQVRIAVDGTHYIKGMAMYADDLPPGVNMRFNTNKKKTDPKILEEGDIGALKPLKKDADGNIEPDPQRAFGATTRPHTYLDKNGKTKTSPLNIVNEEGKWDEWSKSLSSQMLSKQPYSLAQQQLAKTQSNRKEELAKINRLTNPVVKQKMLEDFAENADAAAVHLKAAAMPRQSSHVILPMNSMRPTEVYAPNFETGDKVVLIRYPHGGPFEIPALTVNNKNRTAQKILSNAKDAIGIHFSVAEQLSGADFDGDSVLVIKNDDGKVKSRPPLKELDGFDPKKAYPEATGMTYLSKKNTQTEMGKISNLITDMTIKGAPDADIARAVKHSMVVIDAEKHKLNYKLSEKDNGIAHLKTTYQNGPRKGAATLISKAGSSDYVPERKPISGKGGIDPVTGARLFRETGANYDKTIVKVNKRTGEVVERVENVVKRTKGTKMEFSPDGKVTWDGKPMSSGTPMEELYASHAGMMKGLANQARLNSLAIKPPLQNKAARAAYSKEVESLTEKLRVAQRNAPLERSAQILGNAIAKARVDAHPEFDKDDIKKVKYQSLDEARTRTGANKVKIGSDDSPLTDREWEAIQAGAIPSTTLRSILANANMDRVRDLATPRATTSLTPGQMARAKQMLASGKPMSEVSESLGIPRSTLVDNVNRE